MSAIGWAGVVWLASALAAYLWGRPRSLERSSLSRAGRAAGTKVWLPFSGAWQRDVERSDFPSVAAVRRRTQRALIGLAAISLGLAAAWVVRPPEHGPATPESVAAPATSEPTPSAAAAAPRAPQPQRATTAAEAAEPPSPQEESANELTLEEKRTPTRLFGSANVRPVYDAYTVKGVEILNVSPGSFWELVGVESGDVVVEVHGDVIDSPADTLALLHTMERDERVRIRVRGTDGVTRFLEFVAPQ